MILHYEGTLVEQLFLEDVAVDFLFKDGVLYYYRRDVFEPLMGNAEAVIVDDSANLFFELHFVVDSVLDGSVEAGFTHPDDARLGFTVERSEDLQTWFTDMVTSGTVEDQMDGTWLYKARSPVLVNSVTKTGQLVLDFPTPNPLANPLTGVTIGDVPLSLPNFPYDMPADAAVLEADLVAAGFTGATVTDLMSGRYWVTTTYFQAGLMASPVDRVVIRSAALALPNFPYTIPGDEALLIADLEDLGWADVAVVYQGGYRIEIPDVASSAGYNVVHQVLYPTWLTLDDHDQIAVNGGGASFHGNYVNGDDIRTLVPSQFGRVRMTWTP
jgi:hypothetical protein